MKIKTTIRWKKDTTKKVSLNIEDAVSAMCHECQGWEWSQCLSPMCPLYSFRPEEMLKDSNDIPNGPKVKPIKPKRVISQAHKDAMKAARLKKKTCI